MRWDSLLLRNVSRATKKVAFTKQLIKIFVWLVQGGKQGPPTGLSVWAPSGLASFSSASSEAGLCSSSVSPFSAGKSLVSWLATSACFPSAALFPLVCTFLSEDLSFPAAFFGFVSTLAGAGSADHLAGPLLRPSAEPVGGSLREEPACGRSTRRPSC